jgi:hypothetical protein
MCPRCRYNSNSTQSSASASPAPSDVLINTNTLSGAAAHLVLVLRHVAAACSTDQLLASRCSYDCCAAAAVADFTGSEESALGVPHKKQLKLQLMQLSIWHVGQGSIVMRAAALDDRADHASDSGVDGSASHEDGVGVVVMPCSGDAPSIITGVHSPHAASTASSSHTDGQNRNILSAS